MWHLLEQNPIFAVPVVSVRRPGFNVEPFRIMSLGFEQDSGVFRVDDINTFIIAYFLPDTEESKGGVKIPVSSKKMRLHNISHLTLELLIF